MFLHKVENDYFDVLTKKYIHPEQLTEKSRYSLSGDSVYVLDTIRNFLYSLSDRHNCLQQKLDSVESFMLDVFTQLLFVSDSRQ